MKDEIKRLRSYLAVREANSKRSFEHGNHIHGFGTVTGETALYASDIRFLLDAIEALQADQAAISKAGDRLADVIETGGGDLTPALNAWDKARDAIRARSKKEPGQ